jgi:hypothetical protein
MAGMVSRTLVLALCATALPGSAWSAGPAAEPLARVAVVIDRASASGSRHAAAMASEADAIWRRHGIGVYLAAAGDAGPGEIRLTITFDPVALHATGQPRLGAIWFDEEGRPGSVIMVDHAAVTARISQAGGTVRSLDAWPSALAEVITARALGRVLAHEIGHFLLGSPAHARHGLMRAAFDGRQLSEWSRRGFELHDAALPRLRARLARLDIKKEPLVASQR